MYWRLGDIGLAKHRSRVVNNGGGKQASVGFVLLKRVKAFEHVGKRVHPQALSKSPPK